MKEHWFGSGVKVNVWIPVMEESMVPDQVPVYPFNETEGKIGAVVFWQIGPIGSKTGISLMWFKI